MYQDDTDRNQHFAKEAGQAIQTTLTLTQLYAMCDELSRWYRPAMQQTHLGRLHYAYQVNIALEEARRAMRTLFTEEFRQAWAELAEAVAAFATAYDVGEVPKPAPPKPPYTRTGRLARFIPAKGVRPTYYTVATPTDKPYRIQHRRSRHK